MDKILGLFTTVFVGVPLVIVSMIICWWMDDERADKGKSNNDSDIRIYVPGRCRRRRSNNRFDMENER